MDSSFLDAMRRATKATQAGDPLDATRLIREALSGRSSAPAGETPPDDFDGVTIEGSATASENAASGNAQTFDTETAANAVTIL